MGSAFDLRVEEFLKSEKVAQRRLRWTGRRLDVVKAGTLIAVVGRPALQGRLELSAHRFRIPNKYSFSIIFRNERVFALDVEPGLSHTNFISLEKIIGTHWQCWPFQEATPDSRNLLHRAWLDEFLKRANIRYPFRYRSPPFGTDQPPPGSQLTLDLIR
jgi:hypothetical protein